MRNTMTKKIIALLMLMLTLSLPAPAEEETVPVLEVHQINVGFADGYLLRLGDVDILIDGGEAVPANPEGLAMAYLREIGVETLDAYIVTHWHLDHAMNLNNVLTEFGTEDTLVYGASPSVYPDYDPIAKGRYVQMKPGDVLEFGGMAIHCVGPKTLENNGYRNQDSLNFVVAYGSRKFLFTGDFAASGNINAAYKDICSNVDVLKFPHHGSEPYEIGTIACRTTSPEYVMVPGVASKFKIWDFFDNKGVDFPRENVLTVADAPFIFLTDGETLTLHTQINPADFAH